MITLSNRTKNRVRFHSTNRNDYHDLVAHIDTEVKLKGRPVLIDGSDFLYAEEFKDSIWDDIEYVVINDDIPL